MKDPGLLCVMLGTVLVFGVLTPLRGADLSFGDEFFEKHIRPILATECYKCHGAEKQKGGLRVDYRDGLLKGGESGAAITPGKGAGSLLIRALQHEVKDLEMPKDGAKLDDTILRQFVQWVDMGAPDPREKLPTASDVARASSWEAIRDQRRQWWSFQPITKPAVPVPRNSDWSDHPVDRFILTRLEEQKLKPAEDTDPRTLIRRLSFVLTGLPPKPGEVEAFVKECSPAVKGSALRVPRSALESLVDRLLTSPQFGERWARHWMDWMRYTETHGSEGDPAIPHASYYRDYLIRALNADVPVDQLILENIAGDLLPKPRINRESGIVESTLGIAQYRFVQHGFTPTDVLDEQVRFTDEQIDVLSKAFLGLTVNCARCHDHKFDAISQKDYYALYGVMASCHPATITVDTPEKLATNKVAIAEVKSRLRQAIASQWLEAIDSVPARMKSGEGRWKEAISQAEKERQSPLRPWQRVRELDGEAFHATWQRVRDEYLASADAVKKRQTQAWPLHLDLTGPDAQAWFRHGNGLPDKPSMAGDFAVQPSGSSVITDIYPGGVYTHLLSTKHNGVLTSPRFKLDSRQLYIRIAGDDGAMVRYVVQNYPRTGTVFPISKLNGGEWRWVKWDVDYWRGDTMYLEATTAADQPVTVNLDAKRSWFGVREALLVNEGQEPPRDEPAEVLAPLFESSEPHITSAEDVAGRYAEALRQCVEAWQGGATSDAQAMFLGFFVRKGLLPNTVEELPRTKDLITEYRRLEEQIPVPTRAPGILEADAFDQSLFVRGNHKQPADPVERRFLEVIDSKLFHSQQSGRLELAREFVRQDNPFTARVMVNRLWHHVFGRGLVGTTDNFGRLGDKPTHPDLLDYLASRFQAEGWSMKSMIRLLVTSRVFQLDAKPSPEAEDRDPANLLLSHANVRRLEAEAIRDSLLEVSGRLDRTLFGGSVGGDSPRRSVYIRIIRNQLDPFLSAFDAPAPITTKGRRDVTNVPGQSLMLMNDPFVIATADSWVERLISSGTDEERVSRMFEQAFARPASAGELTEAQSYLAESRTRYEKARVQLESVEAELTRARKGMDVLTARVRDRLVGAKNPEGKATLMTQPVALWDFEKDAKDQAGETHGELKGNARIESGALVVDGNGSYFQSARLTFDARAKTLMAWVQLDTLDQAGGGVMSILTPNGVIFDSIVYAEKGPREWVPGSNNFKRSEKLDGAKEDLAAKEPVLMAIAYDLDHHVRAYRNGVPYGKTYVASDLMEFKAGDTVVTLGVRHLPATGNRMLKGRILEARLYDRALSGEEIAAIYRGDGTFVSPARIAEAMTGAERTEKQRLDGELERLEAALKESQLALPKGDVNRQVWRDFAQALFNMKEFIYLR